ncbi:MAG: Histidinol-phosphate aminotransferase 2 [Pseudomonadota bacterium]|jgi:histidinol-phosphate aminotransferase|nr:histidinol-phosphate transaminase [Burkholderiales bacterium]
MVDLFSLGNKTIQDTKPYQAGKPIEEVERELGITDIIKLASNENPLGPSPKALEAITNSLSKLSLYPDALYYALRKKLAEYTNHPMQNITMGNGSENCLEILVKAYINSGDEVIFDQYSFATTRILIKAYGAKEILVPSNNYRHDIQAMLGAVTPKTKMIVVVNPNNPTGTYITHNELVCVLQNVAPNIIVVVDEAYFEFMEVDDYPNSIELLKRYDNLVITRTFSKAYGLAGVRLGYLLSSLPVSELLYRSRLPFNVNNCACAAGIASLDDVGFLTQTKATNKSGMIQLETELTKMGISFIPSVCNFITIDFKQHAAEYCNKFLTYGIIIRPLSAYGLSNFVRVTIGTKEQNDKFISILKKVYNA